MINPGSPRPAATILLVRDDPFEVLMIARHADQDFSSALVFPGGMVDPADADEAWLPHLSGTDGLSVRERALRVAACRETFEECGLLLARGRDGTPVAPGPFASADFGHLVRQHKAVLALDEFAYFAHWITPEGTARRYDTHFFLAPAPPGQTVCCDGTEAVEAIWVQPAEVLAQGAAGLRKILFPTRMNLAMLARHGSTAEAMAATRQRKVHTVLPRIEQRAHGRAVVIPADAGYDQTEELLVAPGPPVAPGPGDQAP